MDNIYSKILKRDDGSQVKINVKLSDKGNYHSSEIWYSYSIETRAKGKRKWIHVPGQASGKVNKEVAAVVSHSEIWEAQQEFWKSIKPEFPESHKEEGD